ncbi:TIGR02444 family protein [Microvirga brassicacearum]|uniref:TIGR02444 family protein n=1 Tax=Microvirga brassicacearum TaxID=2580413 RepID=A0A5N3PBR1_9HYPH|nr:TIGR02444 family protein [Microvirga brassicacearum]KAB0267222.1 TIGR02444 family protein [Microvirga brassicacearum]
MMHENELEGPHWQFALNVYGRPGVAQICVELQDRVGVDVNVLLMALYRTYHSSTSVSEIVVREMNNAVEEWRDDIVVNLRSIRRKMKGKKWPVPHGAAEDLRNRLKSLELLAEQIELAALADITVDLPCGIAGSLTGASAETIGNVVAYYLQKTALPEEAIVADLSGKVSTIAAAVVAIRHES